MLHSAKVGGGHLDLSPSRLKEAAQLSQGHSALNQNIRALLLPTHLDGLKHPHHNVALRNLKFSSIFCLTLSQC